MNELLKSRKFWAAGIGLVVIVVTAFLPGFPAIQQPLADVAMLVSAYILGTAVEGRVQNGGVAIQGLIRSRKFWAGIAGLAVVLLRAAMPNFPLADDQLTAIIITLSAYIFGTGAQDGLGSLSTRKALPDQDASHV